ncbi:hypothetical protein FRB99_004873 [Tulasnella sp. 403]|nr:hypothetical protein FRB99_004873 [Tulasnella sp. 403]
MLHNVAAKQMYHRRQLNGLVPGDVQGNPTSAPPASTPPPAATSRPPAPAPTSSAAPSSAPPPVPRTSSTPPPPPPPRPTSSAPPPTSDAPETTSTRPVVIPTSAPPTSATPTSTTPVLLPPTSQSPAVINTPTIIRAPTTLSQIGVSTRTFNTAAYSVSKAAPTNTAVADSSGPPVGTIIGAIGGGLVGVVVLAAIAGYFFRRAFRKREDFDRSNFMRNSIAIRDDDYEKSPVPRSAMPLAPAESFRNVQPSSAPRPPSIIERRAQAGYQPGDVVNPAGGYYDNQAYYGYPAGYGYGNQYGNGYDYQQYPQYQTAAVGYTPPSQYQQSELTRKPSAPRNTIYQDGEGEASDNIVVPPGDEFQTNIRHESVTPFQQQQYNEISRQLNNPHSTPLAVPGAGTEDATVNQGRPLSTTYTSLDPLKPSPTYNEPDLGNRSGTPTDRNPQQAYLPPADHAPAAKEAHAAPAQTATALQPVTSTKDNRTSFFENEDAYGGI